MSHSQDNQTWQHLTNQDTWIRLIYMLIYGIMLHFAGVAMWILCGVQFIFTLVFGEDNKNVREMCQTLRLYIHDALAFVSYNSEHKPFPFHGQNNRETEPATDTAKDEVIDADVVKDAEKTEPATQQDEASPTATSSEGNADQQSGQQDADFDETKK